MRSRERGSALITIILVVFVLTMVGIAGVLFMTVEDKISSNDKMQQSGLYGADAGLRVGENVVFDAVLNDPSTLNQFFTYTSSTVPDLTPPGGGWDAVILADPATGVEYHQVAVPVASGVTDRVVYSLYVRNNREDVSRQETVDGDLKVNILSVGQVVDRSGRVLAEKILEEQMFCGGAGGMGGPQDLGNTGGTSSAGLKKP
jgi:hypothetical protein